MKTVEVPIVKTDKKAQNIEWGNKGEMPKYVPQNYEWICVDRSVFTAEVK